MAVAERYAKFARWRERSVTQLEAFTESEMLEFKSSDFAIEELIELEISFRRG